MVVVTGADGLLGQALVRALVAAGQQVRILLRDAHSPGFDGLPVERMTANIMDPLALINAFTGADVVYHCDAMVTLLPFAYPKMYKHNVRGTEVVIHACRICRVRRLVHASSMFAFGYDSKTRVVDESAGFRPQRAMVYFGKTMAIASERVARASGDGLETVIVCGAALVGPYDYYFSQIGKLIWDFGRGRLPVDARGGLDLVDNRDMARACVWAADKAASGAVYLVSGGHISVDRLMRRLQKVTGRRKPWAHMPRWMLYLVCIAYEVKSVFYDGHPVYTRASGMIIRRNQRASCNRLRDDMGFEPTPLTKTLADAWDWFREHHHYV